MEEAASLLTRITAERDALEAECQHSLRTIADERHRAEAAEAERDAAMDEVKRLRRIVERDPKSVMIAFEDGDHRRLVRAAAESEARAIATEIELAEARDTAIEECAEHIERRASAREKWNLDGRAVGRVLRDEAGALRGLKSRGADTSLQKTQRTSTDPA